MYERYKNRVEFLLVYVREAHPTDGWQVPVNQKEGVLYADPKTAQERQEIASVCVRKLDIRFPAVVDNIENTTEQAYTAWPDRLYLVDQGGKIAWKGGPGPAGFRPEDLEAQIQKLLGGSN